MEYFLLVFPNAHDQRLHNLQKYQGINGVKLMTHYEFMKEISLAWINPLKYWTDTKKIRSMERLQSEIEESDGVNTRSGTNSTSTYKQLSKRSQPFSNTSLDPRNGALKERLLFGGHWPKAIPPKRDVNCQLHRWATGKKHRSKLMTCMQYNVNLCIRCFYTFHTKQTLTGDFKKEMQLQEEVGRKKLEKVCEKLLM